MIQIHLPGGMAQQESWDPKPEAPVEYRGAFNVAKTNTGEVFSENFTRTAPRGRQDHRAAFRGG